MKSFFKSEVIQVDGETLTIQELSAGDNLAISEKGAHMGEIICSRCVKEWKDETVETLRENVPSRVMNEIVERVLVLSGIDVSKNSEPTPDAGSFSA